MKLISEFRNELLKRKEVKFSVEAESNPGFTKVIEECANHFKVENERVVIKRLWNNFGTMNFFVEAFVYDSIEDKNNIEPKPKVKKEAAKAAIAKK